MGIIIMGKTGSGKSTLGKMLASRTSFELYEIGHEVKKVFLERVKIEFDSSLPGCDKDYLTTNQRLKYTDDIVKKYGNDYYVRRILEKHSNENIIVVGVRSMAEINAVKNKIRFPFFVGLTCAEEEILRRFINRESEFMSPDEAQKVFNERKMREEKWGMEDVLSQANLILQTDYEKPFELSTAIMERYNEFVRQQMELESKKIIHEDFLR